MLNKLNRLIAIIKDYIANGFYGKIEISFEDGDIVNTKISKNIKL